MNPILRVQLEFPGITLISLSVEMKGRNADTRSNLLQTHWTTSDVNMSRGLDFAPKGNVYARVKHLEHTPFNYKIQVENSSATPLRGTIRIFLAPTKNEFDLPLSFREQRLLMIELDRFKTNRKSTSRFHSFSIPFISLFFITVVPGINQIIRRSDESSVTTSPENIFQPDVLREQPDAKTSLFCSCGWPQYMLIPRGSESGTQFTLFAIVSNLDDDEVRHWFYHAFKHVLLTDFS